MVSRRRRIVAMGFSLIVLWTLAFLSQDTRSALFGINSKSHGFDGKLHGSSTGSAACRSGASPDKDIGRCILAASQNSSKVIMVLAASSSNSSGARTSKKPDGAYTEDKLRQIKEERQRYADRHGYTFRFFDLNTYKSKLINLDGARIAWQKVPILLDVLNEYPNAEWVWWLDQDAFIMNEKIDLYDHLLSERALMKAQKQMENQTQYHIDALLPPDPRKRPVNIPFNDVNIIVSEDVNTLNAGSFFIRNSEWMKLLLDIWSDDLFRKDALAFHDEQGALFRLITRHELVKHRTAFVHQKLINSGWYNWSPGDLVVHLAGCKWSKTCESHWWEFSEIKRTGRKLQLVNGVPTLWTKMKLQQEKLLNASIALSSLDQTVANQSVEGG